MRTDTVNVVNDEGVIKYSGSAFDGPYLKPSGPDIRFEEEKNNDMQAAGYGVAVEKRVWDCEFQNCVFSQPPSYLFFCCQKSTDCMSFRSASSVVKLDGTANEDHALAGDAVGDVTGLAKKVKAQYRNIIQNQDSNLAIVRFKLLVQSSLASWELTSDKFPFLLDTQQLWDVHKKNCNNQYFKDSGIDEWNRRACCLKLSCSDYMQGLGASFGSAFPITISATVTFANRSAFVTGLKYSDARAPGPILHQELIHGRGVMVGIFDRQIAQLSSASAVLSAQNFTATTVSALLQRRS